MIDPERGGFSPEKKNQEKGSKAWFGIRPHFYLLAAGFLTSMLAGTFGAYEYSKGKRTKPLQQYSEEIKQLEETHPRKMINLRYATDLGIKPEEAAKIILEELEEKAESDEDDEVKKDKIEESSLIFFDQVEVSLLEKMKQMSKEQDIPLNLLDTRDVTPLMEDATVVFENGEITDKKWTYSDDYLNLNIDDDSVSLVSNRKIDDRIVRVSIGIRRDYSYEPAESKFIATVTTSNVTAKEKEKKAPYEYEKTIGIDLTSEGKDYSLVNPNEVAEELLRILLISR